MRTIHRSKSSTGFTLVELIVTLVVAGILMALATPSFFNTLMTSRITTNTNTLVATLSFARSEAVKRGIPVSICASNDGTSCTGATNWQNGWIVFTDNAIAGTVDVGDTVLRVQQALDAGVALGADRAFVQYLPTGLLVENDSDSEQLTTWVAKLLWALVPISDAMADGSGASGSSGASGGSGSGGGGSGGSGSGGGGGGAAAVAAVGATFTVCDNKRTGESGRSISLNPTGRPRLSNITCD